MLNCLDRMASFPVFLYPFFSSPFSISSFFYISSSLFLSSHRRLERTTTRERPNYLNWHLSMARLHVSFALYKLSGRDKSHGTVQWSISPTRASIRRLCIFNETNAVYAPEVGHNASTIAICVYIDIIVRIGSFPFIPF